MSKVKYYELSAEEREELLQNFFKAISEKKDSRQVEAILRELLTPSELVMISRRLQIAKMLISGASYIEIIERLGVGTRTITFVDKWLNRGLEKSERVRIPKGRKGEKEDMAPSFTELKKRYPGFFWLFD